MCSNIVIAHRLTPRAGSSVGMASRRDYWLFMRKLPKNARPWLHGYLARVVCDLQAGVTSLLHILLVHALARTHTHCFAFMLMHALTIILFLLLPSSIGVPLLDESYVRWIHFDQLSLLAWPNSNSLILTVLYKGTRCIYASVFYF